MSSMFEQLWPAFVDEVSEQIVVLELELLKNNKADIDVRKLFRQFHTIKSSCGMLSFTSMEAIAHKSEDILDVVREGHAELSSRLIEVLLNAIDALRTQMQEAELTKQAPKARADVVSLLGQELDKLLAHSAIENEKDEQDKSEESNEIKDVSTLAQEQGILSVSMDKQQSDKSLELQALSVIIGDHLINVVSKKTKRNTARILESISQVNEACEALGYKSMSVILKKLELEYVKENANSYAIISYISDLLARMETLEKAFDIDLSCNLCRDLVFKSYRKEFISAVEGYINELNAFNGLDDNAEYLAEWESKILGSTYYLINFSRLFSIHEFTEYLNVSYQILKKHVYSHSDFSTIKSVIDSIKQVLMQQAFDQDVKRFLNYTEQQIGGVKGEIATKDSKEILKGLSITSIVEWTHYLSGEKINEVADFYEKGGVIREIFIDFNFDEKACERFVNWIYEHLKVVTNISVFENHHLPLPITPTVAFLAMDEDTLINEEALDSLDSEGRFLYHCHYTKSSVVSAHKGVNKSQNNLEQGTLRISSSHLDSFVSQVGELVMARNSMAHVIHDETFATGLFKLKSWAKDRFEIFDEKNAKSLLQIVDEMSQYRDQLVQADLRIQSTISRMQNDVLSLRVVPIGIVFNRLPRLVHGLNHDLGKQVILDIQGENEKIDKGLVDVLMEPMLHLVRNAVDHGIEDEQERLQCGKSAQGHLTIRATTLGNMLSIEVIDDGRGINREKIIAKAKSLGIHVTHENAEDLIFSSGFSTKDTLSETSGRGVGLDAVKTSITNIGGTVHVESQLGKGTRFILSLPVSVAIQGVVLVQSEQQQFAIPERNIEEVVSFELGKIQQLNGQASYLLRDEVLPLFNLDCLMFPSQLIKEKRGYRDDENKEATFLVLSNGKEKIALVVADVLGRQEIFVRDVNKELLKIPGFGGASVLGDGSVVVILDCESLIGLAAQNAQAECDILRANIQ